MPHLFANLASRALWLLLGPLTLVILVACNTPVQQLEVTRTRLESVTTDVTRLVTSEVTATPAPAIVVVTRVVTATVAIPAPGSPERPLQLILAPTFDEPITTFRGEALAEALRLATDLVVELQTPSSHAAALDAVCAAPEQAVALLPAAAAVLAREQCGATELFVAERNSATWEAGMIVVRTFSPFGDMASLDGARWGLATTGSGPNYHYFRAFFEEMGLNPGEIVEFGSDSGAVLGLMAGEADFITASFQPPLLPRLARDWQYGVDDPEIWRQLGLPPYRHPVGFIIVLARPEDGGYRIRDARAAVFDVAPGVFDQTRVLTLGAPFAHELVVFGGDMALAPARRVSDFLLDYVHSEACQQSVCSGDFYNWSDLHPPDETALASFQFVRDQLNLTPAELLQQFTP